MEKWSLWTRTILEFNRKPCPTFSSNKISAAILCVVHSLRSSSTIFSRLRPIQRTSLDHISNSKPFSGSLEASSTSPSVFTAGKREELAINEMRFLGPETKWVLKGLHRLQI